MNLYSRKSVGVKQKIDVPNVFDDEKQNKASIFSGSFRYFAPIVVDAILKNNFAKLEHSANVYDALYNLTILDAIKKSANTNKSINFENEKNYYV